MLQVLMEYDKHPNGCGGQLPWKDAYIHAHFFQRAILTRKVGYTDLVFGAWSGFVTH